MSVEIGGMMMEEETVWNAEEPVDIETTDTEACVNCCFAKKYRKAQETCRSVAMRIRKDLREADGNPYIRATTTRRYDLYRSAKDDAPIDSFVFERSHGIALRTLILATGILTAAHLAFGLCRK